MNGFSAPLEIIGINPFVLVPELFLKQIFRDAGKDKGPIPVCGVVNGVPYQQTLVKFRGKWRFYINTAMLPHSPKRIGELIKLTIQFDRSDRSVEPNPKFLKALNANKKAKTVFKALSPSRQKEIVRYISHLKTEKSIETNIEKAIGFLLGFNKFIGRDRP